MSARQLVVLRGRLWIHPSGDAHALQCVARTRTGARCQNPVEYDQALGFHDVQLGPAGYVHACGSPGPGDGVDADRWFTQRCRRHDAPDVIDCATPELRRFDIVSPPTSRRTARTSPMTRRRGTAR